MLHFDNEVLDVDMIPISDQATYLKSKDREASLNGALSDISQWVDGFVDDKCAFGSGYRGLDQSLEGWLADYSNNSQPENGDSINQEIITPTRQNIIFEGAVTLKDINQKILTPPSSKSKKSHEQDPANSYPTSAFSGKPVVGKTKIHTEGGKGSITIMRTKG
ncbi:hypothetical protein L2E82_20253 [Cichorium intybus]|uniref:Uncharacterized protein n=1 Tax=Cichorium intybus TaxID=13427 RepID=A0ACB9DT34_CICIN|nr:hypothetical protein L2E82_20253 [Cichorium intybus]